MLCDVRDEVADIAEMAKALERDGLTLLVFERADKAPAQQVPVGRVQIRQEVKPTVLAARSCLERFASMRVLRWIWRSTILSLSSQGRVRVRNHGVAPWGVARDP